jgi:hypothetical protein
MPAPKNEPEKFSSVLTRHSAGHVSTPETDLHQVRGEVVGLELERIL